jgi:hypothetical protein
MTGADGGTHIPILTHTLAYEHTHSLLAIPDVDCLHDCGLVEVIGRHGRVDAGLGAVGSEASQLAGVCVVDRGHDSG